MAGLDKQVLQVMFNLSSIHQNLEPPTITITITVTVTVTVTIKIVYVLHLIGMRMLVSAVIIHGHKKMNTYFCFFGGGGELLVSISIREFPFHHAVASSFSSAA